MNKIIFVQIPMREFGDRKNAVTGLVIVLTIFVLSFALVAYDSYLNNGIGISVLNNRYKDGTYEVIGEYISPGGREEIDVKITLANGVIKESTVIPRATFPVSKNFQQDFTDNYKEFVTGRNIDEVKLDVVSGSSLTPKGFNDALEKIKLQAQI